MIEAEAIRVWTPWLALVWFLALFVCERKYPLRRASQPGRRRYWINAIAVALALGVAAYTVGPSMEWSLDWSRGTGVGLLQWIALPAPVALLLGILLLDLSFYYWHRINHAVPLLWRFHNVHHIDPDLDSTTSFRFHFGEIAYSSAFRVVQIVLIGPSLTAFVVYEAIFLCATVFHHSNVALPLRLERTINLVFVTPRMHGIHHSIIREETNSNYSVVFRWWDVIHRSLRLHVPQDRIRIGVAGYTQDDDNSLLSVLLLPFRRQRDYWRTPEGETSHHRRPSASPPDNRLTE